MNRCTYWSLSLFMILGTSAAAAMGSGRELALSRIRLPQGFTIAIYAADVPHARSMSISPGGTLFVGTRNDDKVYAVLDDNKDQKADRVLTIASGLNTPNGVAVRDGDLYVAQIDRILRFDDIEQNLASPPEPRVIYQNLPSDRHHGWKFIRFGPDGKLYVPIGAPCNVCRTDDLRYATITRLNPDGSGFEIYSAGIRNSVGFDWDPSTGSLWFTDNGRDWLGDDRPPDELNRADRPGLHFGFPFCHGGDIPDPAFGADRPCGQFTPPAIKLGPHVAALGMRFYTGSMFPEKYHGQIFIAEHGSWNRSQKIGYRISLVTVKGTQAVAYEPFADGWLTGDEPWGRPVDVEVMQDGSLLVSDDKAGAIYRISYRP